MSSRLNSIDGAGAGRWLLVAALALFSWNVWSYDLWAPDEPFFGEGAREMIVDGRWLVPHINGEVNTHKPPLFFWFIALLSLPFGEVSSVTARLPSVIAALITMAATMTMVRRAGSRRMALFAGAILMTSFLFWEKARMAQIDSLLCCLITLAILALAEYRAGRLSGRVAGIGFWAACALAALAKGPVGLLVPLGTAVLVLVSERSLSSWRGFAPLGGPLAFVAIGGLWIGALQAWPVEGYSVVGALREHFVDRGLHGMHHLQPWWYFGKVLPWALFPWSLLLPAAAVHAWRRRSDPLLRLALVHSAFVLLFFSVSAEKRGLYILPALPTMAVLVAAFLDSLLGKPESRGEDESRLSRRWLLVPQGIVAGVMVLLGVAVPFVTRREFSELLLPSVGVGLSFVVGGAFIAHAVWRGRLRAVVLSTWATMAAVLLAIATVYPSINPAKSGRALAGEVDRAVSAMGQPRPTVAAFDIANSIRPINFYAGIYAETIDPGEEARLFELLATGEPFVLVADRASLPAFESEQLARLVATYETRLSRRDLVVFRVEGG